MGAYQALIHRKMRLSLTEGRKVILYELAVDVQGTVHIGEKQENPLVEQSRCRWRSYVRFHICDLLDRPARGSRVLHSLDAALTRSFGKGCHDGTQGTTPGSGDGKRKLARGIRTLVDRLWCHASRHSTSYR